MLGLGEYKLKVEFLSVGIPADEMHLMETISLEDIIKSIKEDIDTNVERIKSNEVIQAK